jgi:HrpA-like RNA helicase
MPLPTLLVKGSLRANETSTQEELNDWIPLEYIIKWFSDKMNISVTDVRLEDRILLLISKTGSGKSTSLPTKVHSEFFKRLDKTVAVTQPRVLTAMDIPRSIVEEDWAVKQGFKLGKNIGFHTGNFTNKPLKGVIYMTIGVLAQQLKTQTDEWLCNTYSFIIIDECHVKPPELDSVIYLMKKFLIRNVGKKSCPFLVFTSATFRIDDYAEYFGVGDKNIITVEGSGFPITENYLEFGTNNYKEECAKVVEKIHKKHPDDSPDNCDILVFLPGVGEMKDVAKFIKNSPISNEILILSIDGRAVKNQTKDYLVINTKVDELFIPTTTGTPSHPKRKIILSTNVAETGLTLDYLKYVVDSGWNRGTEFNPNYGLRCLVTKPAVFSMTVQRKGRAGRKQPGNFFPLYTEKVRNSLRKDEIPEIYNSDLSLLILNLYSTSKENKEILDFEKLDLIDPPSTDSIVHANNLLFSLGLLGISPLSQDEKKKFPDSIGEESEKNEEISTMREGFTEITKIGEIINKLFFIHHDETRIQVAKMILSGFAWKCSILDLITIGSFLNFRSKDYMPGDLTTQFKIFSISAPSYFSDPRLLDSYEDEMYKFKTVICDDFIEPIFIFRSFMKNIQNAENWCSEHKIRYETMIEILKIRDDIIEQFMGLGIDVFYGDSILDSIEKDFMTNLVNLKQCIYEGFKMNLVEWNGSSYVHSMFPNISVKEPDMLSAPLYKKLTSLFIDPANRPKYLIAGELTLKPKSPKSTVYIATSDKFSVLDGYIHPDPGFFFGK